MIVYIVLGVMAAYKMITIGNLLVIISLFNLLTDQMRWTSASYIDMKRRLTYIQCIYDFLKTTTESNWPGNMSLSISDGNIQLKNVLFAYSNGTKIFDGLNLCIVGKKRTALIGESGCGKSTLAYLLEGLYRIQNGEILIDNQNLYNCSLKSIRSKIGLVSQDYLIFNGTIRENIIMGMPEHDISDIEIIEACRNAGVYEFINSLSEGLDTVIGQAGINLSGGQKQRIVIARIYIRQPEIIIFDEATSALDNETENEIREAWNTVLKDRTAIIISHRRAPLIDCDYIGVMEKGKIITYGPVEQNMYENNGRCNV